MDEAGEPRLTVADSIEAGTETNVDGEGSTESPTFVTPVANLPSSLSVSAYALTKTATVSLGSPVPCTITLPQASGSQSISFGDPHQAGKPSSNFI